MSSRPARVHRRQQGQGALEYAIALALVAVVVIAALSVVGSRTSAAHCSVSQGLGQGAIAVGGSSAAASVVYGQGGSMTSGTANNGGVSASSLNLPSAEVADGSGGLYVADNGNNRVLYFPRGSTTATAVYGQAGSFATATANNGGVSASSLSGVSGVALDRAGNLFVADRVNNRALMFPVGSTTATRVFGQLGSFSTNAANLGNPATGTSATADSLQSPYAIALDAGDNVYIANSANMRVLFYPAGTTTATRVYGQGGSFNGRVVNAGGISAASLNFPTALGFDPGGNLLVADYSNNRVLTFVGTSTTATTVYGQGASFSANTANNGGTTAASLQGPSGLSVDPSGGVYIADTLNHRLLFYPPGTTTASRVYGQAGLFSSSTQNSGGVSAASLYRPFSPLVDGTGNLYLSDLLNHRVLEYTC